MIRAYRLNNRPHPREKDAEVTSVKMSRINFAPRSEIEEELPDSNNTINITNSESSTAFKPDSLLGSHPDLVAVRNEVSISHEHIAIAV
ncbi:hypothetical protein VKT23_003663 [Stygiomarasmius scandens]|uniref:Uncharacterized protein n=1 Tax=Marasmiellus scandens TaxID=2682957 RepID=A0ABR1K4B7_9AGAR